MRPARSTALSRANGAGLVVIAWLIICGSYLRLYSGSIHWFSLGDTDDNMRYLQVRDWLNGQSWWDLSQHRMDPPRGANIHWSRLVDLPIAALMLFFRLFMSPMEADKLALGVAPLIPLLPLMLALAFIARRLTRPRPDGAGGAWSDHGWFVAMLLPLGTQMGLGMFMPMRVDHHGWQLALTATALAGLVDRQMGARRHCRGRLQRSIRGHRHGDAGLSGRRGRTDRAALVFKDGAARRLQPYALSLGGTTALGYAFFASYANRQPVCDALSPSGRACWCWRLGCCCSSRSCPCAAGRSASLPPPLPAPSWRGFFYFVWPQCLTGVYQISPELQRSWLAYIREAKPLMAQSRASAVPMTAIPAVGLLCALIGCWSARAITSGSGPGARSR